MLPETVGLMAEPAAATSILPFAVIDQLLV
jgi:hypothetical protein